MNEEIVGYMKMKKEDGSFFESSIRAKIQVGDTTELGVDIPCDPANRHYQAYLEWVAEGNTIEEAD